MRVKAAEKVSVCGLIWGAKNRSNSYANACHSPPHDLRNQSLTRTHARAHRRKTNHHAFVDMCVPCWPLRLTTILFLSNGNSLRAIDPPVLGALSVNFDYVNIYPIRRLGRTVVEGFIHVSGITGLNPERVEQNMFARETGTHLVCLNWKPYFQYNFHFGHGNIHVTFVNLTLKDSKFLGKLLRYNY